MFSILYEALKNNSSYEIIEVEHSKISLAPNDLLTERNIKFDELIGFHNESGNSCKDNVDTPGGYAIFTRMNSEIKPIIVINIDPFHSNEELSKDEDIISLSKYVTLLHEFGHIDDFENQINFKLNPYSVNVDLTEAYAEIFTLKKLIKQTKLDSSILEKKISQIALNKHVERMINGLNTPLFSDETKNKIRKSYKQSELRKYQKDPDRMKIKNRT